MFELESSALLIPALRVGILNDESAEKIRKNADEGCSGAYCVSEFIDLHRCCGRNG
jgi:hypothetical protein